MNIKRTAKIIIAALFILNFGVCAYAVNTDDYYKDRLEASGADKLSESLSPQAREFLEKLGCEDIEFEKILDVSPKTVFKLLAETVKDGIKAPLKGMTAAAGAVILISVCAGFFPDDDKSKTVLNTVCGCFLVISVFVPAANSVRAAASAIGMCAAFEKALIPVLAALAAVGGNPALALSVRGAALAAAEFIEAFSQSFALPLVGASGALGVTGAMLPTLRLSAVSEVIRKTLLWSLSSAAALFSGFLTLKGILSSAADSLTAKGVKLAANTFVPVVGGAIGEAYSSVTGSLSLLRSTVGIYAVAAFFAIGIPVIINLALWTLAMRLACAVSDLLDCRQCSEILKNTAFVFSMINTLLLLCMVVFIISAGIIALIKTGE